ncbi:AlpA family phage regulatory protein [Klebsiella pneumoniae]|nr:AlpA family phage regulatory protein [Klebsiella pneumoniae]
MTNKTHPISSSPQTTTSLLNDQLVDMTFITGYTNMTDKWFYRLISENAFPAPIKLGRSSRWLKSEVEEWVNSRIIASRGSDKKRF